MVFLAAILDWPFEIRTFGSHFELIIWNPDFLVRISNGKNNMTAKKNIIDIYGISF